MKILIAGILIGFSLSAHAARPEVGIGMSRYNASEDGRWYQSSYPHSFDLTGAAFQVGVRGDNWHLDAVSLGNVSSTAQATARDAAYFGHVPIAADKLATFNGTGHVYGIAVTYAPSIQLGSITLSAEAGAFYYYATWDESIQHWHPPGCPSDYMDIIADHSAHWALSGVVGVSASYGSWSLQYRYFKDPATGDSFPALYDHTQTVSLVYMF